MKKILAIFLAVAMLLSLAACGGKTEDTPETAPKAETAAPTQSAEETVNPLSFTFTQYGDVKITVVGAEFTQDDYGEDVLRIYYDYTNTGDSADGRSPDRSLQFASITQDGQELRIMYFGTLDECAIAEDLTYGNFTQPGCTSRQTMLIPCDPNGGIVEVSCYAMVGSWVYEPDKTECFTFQIDPKNLMGAPEKLEMPAIMNPTYAAGLATSGTNDYPIASEMSIDNCELTKGDNGEDVLRVYLTVTNLSDESAMPMSITNGVEAYQDGFGLNWFSTWHLEATESDEAYETDLAPGETVRCSALFQLRNDHPVEIVIENMNSELRLGTILDVKAAVEAIRAAEEAQQQAANAAEAAARAALVGAWLQRDSDWEDTYYFNADGTGLLVSGPEYPFTYSISGNTLTLDYGEDDIEEFTITVEENLLTMINQWEDELLLDRIDAEAPPVQTEPAEEETEPAQEETEAGVSPAEDLIGTWHNEGSGETYVFNADGTGYQIYEGNTYTFTYEASDNYVYINYDDGSTDTFNYEIYDGMLIIASYWTYDRQ